ncbi:leptin receptor gene-related protein [Halictus rubicundus]|uniref:leptin receptor gene-related protein n=1 Tax=Halictus rubicundus TaxID=77578 RepID=UPI00403621D0
MTLVILACGLPQYNVWWPFFVVLFYVLAPIPTIVIRRREEYDNGITNNSGLELAIFITMGFLISSFALPIVLARSPASGPVIQWGACYLTLSANIVVYLTLFGFFSIFEQEDTW